MPVHLNDDDIERLVRIDGDSLFDKMNENEVDNYLKTCLLYTSPSPRDAHESRMPSSA